LAPTPGLRVAARSRPDRDGRTLQSSSVSRLIRPPAMKSARFGSANASSSLPDETTHTASQHGLCARTVESPHPPERRKPRIARARFAHDPRSPNVPVAALVRVRAAAPSRSEIERSTQCSRVAKRWASGGEPIGAISVGRQSASKNVRRARRSESHAASATRRIARGCRLHGIGICICAGRNIHGNQSGAAACVHLRNRRRIQRASRGPKSLQRTASTITAAEKFSCIRGLVTR